MMASIFFMTLGFLRVSVVLQGRIVRTGNGLASPMPTAGAE
jgi:hypothetical protein